MNSFLAKVWVLASEASADIAFHAPLFSDGMILQRGERSQVWGSGAVPKAKVTMSIIEESCASCPAPDAWDICCTPGTTISTATTSAGADGAWRVSLPKLDATKGDQSTMVQLTASDGATHATISKVAVGDVLLCGGQSNMGFTMCGAHSKAQPHHEALEGLPPIRTYFQVGSGPGGQGCKTSDNRTSSTPRKQWLTANATNSGGFSAVCLLTAQRVFDALDGTVPVGAVESCVSGTYVEPWTPPAGDLWKAHMEELVPMTFRAALWDQGEADAKRTNSTWYTHEFPRMILGWRDAFEVPDMPFIYVELPSEYDAEEPKEDEFWYAQRAATELPQVGYAVTVDIQRTLHPPDKQDIADRLALEFRRIVYGENVVSRGPELISAESDGKTVVLTFSNASLSTHAGIFIGNDDACAKSADSVVIDPLNNNQTLNYTISGSKMTVSCVSPSGHIRVNGDQATCFLYGPSGLPAPPILQPCSPTESVYIV